METLSLWRMIDITFTDERGALCKGASIEYSLMNVGRFGKRLDLT